MNGQGSSTDPSPKPPLAADPPIPLAPPEPKGPTLAERVRAAPLTFAILAVNAAVFLWAESKGSTESTAILLRFGAIEPVHVWMGEYWRLATYMFLHIGWMHILFNSYGTLSFAPDVERALGRSRFLAVYLLSGVGGGCVSVILSPSLSAGASGAIYGVVGALLALRRRRFTSFRAFFADRAARAMFFNIAIWTVLGQAMKVNHFAHFGGLAVGAVATWAATAPRARALGWALVGVGIAALVVGAIHPWTPTGKLASGIPALANAYLHGEGGGIEKDPARGMAIAERGCTEGVAQACLVLGAALSEANDPAKDLRAYDLFHRGCEAGDNDACGAEGWALALGRGVAKDEARGTKVLSDACAKGSKNSCAILKDPGDAREPGDSVVK